MLEERNSEPNSANYYHIPFGHLLVGDPNDLSTMFDYEHYRDPNDLSQILVPHLSIPCSSYMDRFHLDPYLSGLSSIDRYDSEKDETVPDFEDSKFVVLDQILDHSKIH